MLYRLIPNNYTQGVISSHLKIFSSRKCNKYDRVFIIEHARSFAYSVARMLSRLKYFQLAKQSSNELILCRSSFSTIYKIFIRLIIYAYTMFIFIGLIYRLFNKCISQIHMKMCTICLLF